MTAARPLNLLLLGVTALVTLLLVAGVAVAILDEIASDERRSVRPLGDVRSIAINADEGDVEIRTAPPGTRASIETIEQRGLLGGPDVNVRTDGGRIDADSDCWAFVFGSHCSTRWIVRVPRGTPVEVRTGAGDVAVLGAPGPTRVATGSGDVDVSGARGGVLHIRTGSGDVSADDVDVARVDARTGSGDIEGTALVAPEVELDASSGDIDVTAAEPPLRLGAETGSGDVTLAVPDAQYAVTAVTGSGDENVTVPQDPSARHRLRLRTGSGDIDVRPR